MWWNKNDDNLTYCSYKVKNTEVLIGPRLDKRGCSLEFFNSIQAWLSVTESYVEYPITANMKWFPWKEMIEKLPDHVLFGSLKLLNYWINELELPRVYIHCDLGTHRAPSTFGAFLFGYYENEMQEIVSTRKIKNRKQSTIIGSDGKSHGNPIEYFKSYSRDLPDLETKIKIIVNNPKLDLEGVCQETFSQRPLSMYTEDELEKYNQEKKEKEYQERIKQWLIELGFEIDKNHQYSNFHNVKDPNGDCCHIIGDMFIPEVLSSLGKYGQVYLTHNKIDFFDRIAIGYDLCKSKMTKNEDLILVHWVVVPKEKEDS